MTPAYDTVWTNLNLHTAGPLGQIPDAAIAVKDGLIAWLGPMTELAPNHQTQTDALVNCEGKWALPGLIDCHTHLVFAGQRAGEFKARLNGDSYKDIAAAGGGIISTVKRTRAATENALFTSAAKRLKRLIREGVTTVEIKSGYGLNTETEAKMLRVARRLGQEFPVNVVTSFLGAHALPNEFRNNRQAYLHMLCSEMLPALASENLIDAVDGFCETIAFSTQEIEQLFSAAQALGLPLKLHTEQLSDTSGAKIAARFGALSADHLEYLSEEGAREMAKSGTVAVLLPGAYYMLRETQSPPVDLLRKYKIPIAIASDCNPGSSPALSLQLMANMACQLFALTVDEALQAITVNAAQALGLDESRGSLEIAKRADFALYDIDDPTELAYWLGGCSATDVIVGGKETDLSRL